MNMKNLLIALALALAGCATVAPDAAPADKKPLDGPEMARLSDPNPYANYEEGMASDPARPMAYEWQTAHEAEANAATSCEAIAAILESNAAIAELLASVKPGYATDPLVAMKIAAATQMSMCTKCDKAPAARARWTAALLDAAKSAPDAYRKMFFLDQLRWCGRAEDVAAIRAVGDASPDAAVRDFAALVAREIQ